MEILLIFGVMMLAMYFLMIRPQQKKQRAQQTMLAELGPGDRIMLTSGIFATIKHMGDKQAVVEIAPGVEFTILRPAIMRAVKEDEDEFEYADDAEAELDIVVPDDASALIVEGETADEAFARPADEDADDQPADSNDESEEDRGSAK